MISASALITGGTGWLGKQTASRLIYKFGSELNLVLTSSKSTDLTIRGQYFRTVQNSQVELQKNIDYLFDYAFLTREKIDLLGAKEYFNVNLSLINFSTEIVKRFKPKVVILASSGAIYGNSKFSETKNHKLYADLKLLQEQRITEACNESGSRVIIVRVFNLSGNGINKSKVYAIQEFIETAIRNKPIVINSNFQVKRRYCDVDQLIDLLLALSSENKSVCFDSGGPLVELHELARIVKETLNSNSRIVFKQFDKDSTPDNYFSNSKYFEMLIEQLLKQDPLSIEAQIIKTAKNFTS